MDFSLINILIFIKYAFYVDSRGKSQAFFRGSKSNESEKMFPKMKFIFRVDLPLSESTGVP